jgi:glutathione synthase/RimK-type ligase-like ATP-grasp enzyme
MTQDAQLPHAAQSLTPPGGLVLTGLPDDGEVRVKRGAGPDGVSVIYPGTAAFLEAMPEDIQRWPRLLLPLPRDGQVEVPRLPLVNHMGDADRYRGALQQAAVVIEKLGMPCFNHPAAVLRTTRDGISAMLQGIPGVVMPRTVRISPRRIEDFPQAVEEHGLRYPVIARLTGTQTGRTQTLVQSADEWEGMHGVHWRAREVYLTQYVDCRDPDGLYRKHRIVFVGGRPMPNSLLTSSSWSVHGVSRQPENFASEAQWLHAFNAEHLPLIEGQLSEIVRIIGLDLFGLDFSPAPDGRMLIFEVNASMNMISMSTALKFPYLKPARQAIKDEVVALVRDPARWSAFRSPSLT